MWNHERRAPPEARHGASIGHLIREWRLGRGWTQRDLERISGVNQSIISRLENGRVVGLQLSTLGRLAWALKAEEAVLLALAPDGGDEIEDLAAHGLGPAPDQVQRIARRRPRARRRGAGDRAPDDGAQPPA